jgi:RNA polymerase sigma factor (sigma-70 family)
LADDIRTIWQGVRKGDADAWSRLVRLYAGLVNGVARRAGLSVADAEDCAQHTWLSLYRRRRAIKDPRAVPAWLIRTTHRQAVAIARRRGRFTAESSHPAADRSPGPDARLEARELERHLRTALGQLSPRCRRLLNALYLDESGESYRQLAAALKLKPNSLGPLRSRCLQQLAAILKKMGYSAD